jgi:hypothetical protein
VLIHKGPAMRRSIVLATVLAPLAGLVEILRNVRRFDQGEDGALVLRTDDGRTITARR